MFVHFSLQGVSVPFPASRAPDRSRGCVPLIFQSRGCLARLRACHQSKRVAASFTCSACPVIRANVQTWGWSWSGYYSVTFQSPEPLLMFLKMHMGSPGSTRDERPVDILLKSGLPGSTGNSAHLCRARKDPLFQASPRKGPFGCRGPSKTIVFWMGSRPSDLVLQCGPRGPGIQQQHCCHRPPPQILHF